MKLRLLIALAFMGLLVDAQDRPPANANGAQFACNRVALDPPRATAILKSWARPCN